MEHPHLKRRLTAILIADVVGYSRLMGADEDDTHLRLAEYVKDLIEPKVAENGGRLIRSAGDGFLVEFASAVDAVRSGLEIQREMAERNTTVPAYRRVQFRIGINTGDVIVGDRDIYGNSVNIAARLEGLAEPGGVYVTRGVRDQLQGQPSLLFEDRGERRVKNIARPIRVYRVKLVQDETSTQGIIGRARTLLRTQLFLHWRAAAVTAIALAGAAALTVAALPLKLDYSLMSPRASIMVLPFRNVSNNPGQDYFADAVTDDITTDLSRLSDTLVISPATAFTYKGKAVDPRQIRREFGVRYLLEGSIRKDGIQVQTNAQLVDTGNAAHLWADRFDTEIADLSDLQDAITGRIASSLNIEILKAENRRAIAERPADPDAIDLRLRATALLVTSPTPEHHLAARKYLEEAVRLDPNSAESWGQLANVLATDYFNHWNEAKESTDAGKELLRQAEKAVQEALKIDPSIAVAHFAEGFIRRARGDHPGALDALDRAVQLDPNFARARAQRANQLVLLGRASEAVPMVLQAIVLSPRDPAIGGFYWITGRAYFVMKKYDDAIVWLRKATEVSPFWFNRAYLLAAYALTGRHQATEGVEALNDYKSSFSQYTLQRIAEIYEKEFPHTDPGVQASIEELYRGLRTAGVPEQ
jgi:class 3 adenylate cyclase/TolB-like protein/cytochrome c-type biogenesis protein CcmH/NrfG